MRPTTPLRAGSLVGFAALSIAASVHAQDPVPAVSGKAPAPECSADIHWDRNESGWPGYLIDDPQGQACVPFTATGILPPAGYQGDFYVAEFTDAKARQAWADCLAAGPSCADPVRESIKRLTEAPPFRATGQVDAFGGIDPDGEVALADIRRPAYFGQAPYGEAIAEADGRTWIVEVEVPSETFEQKTLGVDPSTTWKQRGWYIEGAGVENAEGETVRALVILSAGRSVETTAIQHPDDPVFTYDAGKGTYDAIVFPTATTEKWGVRQWREYIYKLNQAGFDVLTLDKRGHGISGGKSTSNTVEQARDLFRALDAFETGEGLRIAGADGQELTGAAAAEKLLAGQKAREIPVIIGGPSQGSMVASHAMHLNFVADCQFEVAEEVCGAPLGYNVKGGVVLAEFAHGLGHVPGRFLTEGLLRSEYQLPFAPSGEVLEGLSQWPAVFFGRGLWDFAGGLEGTLDAYERVRGPKEVVVVRGPHSENEYGAENVAHMQDRVVVFAQAVMRGDEEIPGAARFSDLRELVATSPASWEESMRPDGY